MNTKQFKENISLAWCRRTSSNSDDWSKNDPSLGQCAVTACLAQDYLGGKILWCEVFSPNKPIIIGQGISHYLNEINGEIFDFTREQFSEYAQFTPAIAKKKEFSSTRDYILSFSETQKRYDLLKSSFEKVTSQATYHP